MRVFSYSPNPNLNCLAVEMGDGLDLTVYQSYDTKVAVRLYSSHRHAYVYAVLKRGDRPSRTTGKHIGYIMRSYGCKAENVFEVSQDELKDILSFYETTARPNLCPDRKDELLAMIGCEEVAGRI